MSIMMLLMGGGGGPGFSSPINLDVSISTDNLNVNSNGTCTATNEGQPNWFTPTTTGIGNSYWCKLVLLSGSNPTSGTMNTVLALSSNRSWSWNTGVTGSYTLTIYSDAGGSNQVATVTVSAS